MGRKAKASSAKTKRKKTPRSPEGNPQQQLFPAEAAPTQKGAKDQPTPGEIPPAPPQTVSAPPEPTIAGEIVAPPASSFTEEFKGGSLAHALTQPDKNIARVVHQHFQRERYPWVSEWTGAGAAGDPCIRRLAYERLYPEEALPDNEDLAMLFKHGNWVEKEVLSELADAGYEIIEQQRPFVDRDLMVKGKIDGKVLLHFNGKRMKPPFEIKGYAPTTWNRINSAKDLLESAQPYLKKVPAQLMLYIILDKDNSADAGVLYMKNKLTGAVKQIIVPYDKAYADWLLNRLKVLREHVVRKELPARIDFDETVCGKCPFRGTCLKEMPPGVSNPTVLDPEKQAMLLEMLQRWWELDPARKEWKKIDEKISGVVRGHAKIILGDFIVTGKEVPQNRADTDAINALPPKRRQKFMKTIHTWRKGIVNVKDTGAKDED